MGACVCTGCGASKRNIGFPGGPLGLVLYVVFWLGLPFAMVFNSMPGHQAQQLTSGQVTGGLIAAVLILLLGYWILRKLWKNAGRQLWYR